MAKSLLEFIYLKLPLLVHAAKVARKLVGSRLRMRYALNFLAMGSDRFAEMTAGHIISKQAYWRVLELEWRKDEYR